MKKYFIATFLCFFFLSIGINAQETRKEPKSKIGINTTFIGSNNVFTFDDLLGARSVDGKGFYSFGISYAYILSKRIELQSGIEFSRHKVSIEPAFMGPEFDNSPWKENVKLLTIPLTANVNFGKYFFINGGFLVDFEMGKKNSVDRQSGLGATLGLGGKYDFDSGISLFISPYYKVHTLVPFSSEKYHERMQEIGLKIGATYSF